MATFAGGSLVVHMLLTMPTLEGPRQISVPLCVILGCTPPVAFCMHVLVLAEVDYSKPGTVVFSHGQLLPLCTFAKGTPTVIEKAPFIAIGFAGCVVLVATGLILCNVIELVRGTPGGLHIRKAMGSPDAPWFWMLFRFLLFVAYVLLATIACIADLSTKDGSVTYEWVTFIGGTFPMAAFLIFGTQMDVWRVWRFWRHETVSDEESASVATVPCKHEVDRM